MMNLAAPSNCCEITKLQGLMAFLPRFWSLFLRWTKELSCCQRIAFLTKYPFYSAWKIHLIFLILNCKSDPGATSSHCSLCMLGTAGNVLEKILRKRLMEAIVAADNLSPVTRLQNRAFDYQCNSGSRGSVDCGGPQQLVSPCSHSHHSWHSQYIPTIPGG